MTAEQKLKIIKILEQAKGDDLYRARKAFEGMTDAQMQEMHGQSGYTRWQIIQRFRQHNEEIDELVEAVKNS